MARGPGSVWFVVGCSSGFGHEIAALALQRGDHVIATSRNASKLDQLKGLGADVIDLDVCDAPEAIQKRIEQAVAKYGRLDVLVNNAGYLLLGSVDECSDDEIKTQYDTNVFGMIRVVRAVLPIMRKQRSGIIANIGSIGGWRASPIGGLYCSTKFAVVGITEAIRGENKSFGIECLVIEPGAFRTNFLAPGHAVEAKRVAEDLSPLSSDVRTKFRQNNHKQPGDPKKGAAVIVDALTKTGPWEGKTLPLRMLLGRDAHGFAGDVITRCKAEFDEWGDVISKTDFNDVISSA